MVDTPRTVSDLLIILADNTTGDISEQDMRDMLVSLVSSFGGMYMEGNATATSIAVADTWYKALGTTTASGDLIDFTMPANNRLTYNDTISRHMIISGAAAITSVANNQLCELSIHKNGVIVPGSIVELKCFAIGDPTTVPISAQIDMSPTDYIELFVKNETSTNNLTVTYFNLLTKGSVHV